jgi:hypothetical protein
MSERQESMIWALGFAIIFTVQARGEVHNRLAMVAGLVALFIAFVHRHRRDK